MTARIALIHATRAAIPPVEKAFSEIWPEAEHWSLLDERLNQYLDRAGELTDDLRKRFVRLATYAADAGIDGLLFTCTAFGPAMEECQREFVFPTLKPNEAMFEVAIESGRSIGLLATHPATLPLLEGQLTALATERGCKINIHSQLAAGAWDALTAGNQTSHDQMVIDAARNLDHCEVMLLAQFSMAPLEQAIQSTMTPKIVSSPHAAVRKMRGMLS